MDMTDLKRGREVRVYLTGTIYDKGPDYITIDTPGGKYMHVINIEHADSITLIEVPSDFSFGSVIWVKVKGEPGTDQVTVVRNGKGERRYRSVLRPLSYNDDELEALTGVDYRALDLSKSPF